MKYQSAIDIYACIIGLQKTKIELPTTAWLTLSKNQRVLKPLIEDFDMAKLELMKRVGKSVDGDANFTFEGDNVAEFNIEMKKLLNTEIDIEIKKITKNELRGYMEKLSSFEGIFTFYEYLIEE